MYRVDVVLSNNFTRQVAISSFMNPNSAIEICLTSNQIAFSKKINPLPEIISSTITDIIREQTSNLTTIIENEKIYLRSDSFHPQKGGIYSIKITTKNPSAIIVATDTIPIQEVQLINILNIPTKNEITHSCTVSFIPSQNEKVSYYELIMYKQNLQTIEPSRFSQSVIKSNDQLITREDYYPNVFLLEAESPSSLLFRVESSSNLVTINFEYDAPYAIKNNGGLSYYTFDHNIKIELRTVSRSYFKYKTTLYTQKYAAEGDLLYGMPEPVKVFSNVAGGLGIIGSYCKSDTTIWVAGRQNLNQ